MKRAEMLAQLGYNAFAVDIYGKGIRPKDSSAAGAEAGKYKRDRELLRARAKAGLETLRKLKNTDPNRIAAIGYCFGGTTVIELARAGADIAGVVSFHGGLDSPKPEAGRNIKCKGRGTTQFSQCRQSVIRAVCLKFSRGTRATVVLDGLDDIPSHLKGG